MRRIVVVNPKGGSGKTTISINLAAFYSANDLPAVLIDRDSQGSSGRWLSKRPDTAPPIHGIDAMKEHVGITKSFAMRIPPETKRIVIDTPAALPIHELGDVIRDADKVLVPVLPSDIDIHAATRLIADLLLKIKVDRNANKLAIVANRVKRNTLAFRSLMRFLDTLKIPVAAVLRDSQNYVRSAESGTGIHEQKQHQVRQDLSQWASLIDWLEHGNARPARLWIEQPKNVTVLEQKRVEPTVSRWQPARR